MFSKLIPLLNIFIHYFKYFIFMYLQVKGMCAAHDIYEHKIKVQLP